MADWRKLALTLVLGDGKIDDSEVKILRKALWADNKIDKEEVAFLIELRNAAQKKAAAKKAKLSPSFESLFFKAIESNVLKDARISANEARWLRDMLFAAGKIDANEARFMMKLKKSAKSTSPEFDALYEECMNKARAKKKAAAAKKK